MKQIKKVAAFLLALLLVLSTASLSVTAEGEQAIGITIRANKTTNLYPGDIVTFTIKISTTFNYTAMRWPVMFTTKAFEPVINGDSDTSYGNVVALGQLLNAPNSVLESVQLPQNSEAFGGAYSKTNYSGILIQWTGGVNGDGLNYFNAPAPGEDCITFQLRVKSGYTANKGVGTVAIPTTSQAKKLFYYQGVTNPSNASTVFKLSDETCTVTSTPCTVNIISELASIQPAAGSDTVIDTSNDINYIYGFTSAIRDNVDITEETIGAFIRLTGKAKFSIEENNTGNCSTGAILHVTDANDVPIGDYTIVVFGDINGDGSIDTYDMSIIISAINNLESWSEGEVFDNAKMLACDVNGDEYVYWEDFNAVELYLKGSGILPNQTHEYGVATTS